MKHRTGFATILLVTTLLVLGVYVLSNQWESNTTSVTDIKPIVSPIPTSITTSNLPNIDCQTDSDCGLADFKCEAVVSSGIVYPNNSKPQVDQVIKGVCKVKEGKSCDIESDCVSGLLCHKNICTNPIGRPCDGSQDTSCPTDYTCVQSCGPPVVRLDDSPPPYFCELKEYASGSKDCPRCLASNTKISTPKGQINVQEIKTGTKVWSIDKDGEKVVSVIKSVAKTPAPPNHEVIHLVLADKHEVWVSPDHPVANIIGSRMSQLRVSDLKPGDSYDGSKVIQVSRIKYWDKYTYDILPDSETGYYYANGILLGSTLK